MKRMKWLIIMTGFLFLAVSGESAAQQGKEPFRAGQDEKVIESLTKNIQENPKNAQAYFLRAASYSVAGQFNQAIDDYTKAIELNPQYSEAYWSRGFCYANMGKDDKAIEDYAAYLKLARKMQALVYEMRASAYYRKGMFDEAEADLKSALELQPEFKKAAEGLEEIKKARNDPGFIPNSIKFRNLTEQPEYGGIQFDAKLQKANDAFVGTLIKNYGTKENAVKELIKWGWQFYNKGDYANSMRRFNEAWLMDKKNPEIFYGYSLNLRAWGYTGDADKWEKKARSSGYRGSGPGKAK
ncbi:MAG: tetratricopeptide repeat protein [Candidatus Omnitrophica bacterium]|nr:tetratricopeptide repeat protein [Candidatus Omnitrophota bacterium]